MAPPRFGTPGRQFVPERGRRSADAFEGAFVLLLGSGFDSSELTVRFGEFEAILLRSTDSRIQARVPFMDPATVKITVTTAEGAVTSDDEFEVLPMPIITGLEPNGFSTDPSGLDLPMEIWGQGFLDGGAVSGASLHLVDDPSAGPKAVESSVGMTVLSATATRIVVLLPTIPNFHRFVGGLGTIVVQFQDGAEAESDSWEIKGF